MLTVCCLTATSCVARNSGKAARRVTEARAAKAAPAATPEAPVSPGVRAKEAQAGKAAAADPKVAAQSWTVEGWGKTLEDAEKFALKKARDKVSAHLQGLDPPMLWMPSLDYVRKNLLTDQPPHSLGQQKVPLDGDNQEQVPGWSWVVNLSPSQVETMRREDAKYRAQLAVQERSAAAEARMLELGKVVGCLVFVLAVVSLLLRKTPNPKPQIPNQSKIQMSK